MSKSQKHEERMTEILKRSAEGCTNILAYVSGYLGDNKEFDEAFWEALEDGFNVE